MKNVIRATIFLSALIWGHAQADIVSFEITSANDCSGYYGSGFDNCVITAEDSDEGISSIISKFDTEREYEGAGGETVTEDCAPNQTNCWSVNSFYDFVPADLVLTYDGNGGTGSWTYSGDIGIRFWVAKASNEFMVYYDTDDSGCAGALASTYACMVGANVVTSGTWTTPLNDREIPRGLSHISFYDTEVRVPEPGTLMLFGLGLLCMGLARRRVRR